MMKKATLLFLFFSLNVGLSAESVPLPPSVPALNDVVTEFRNVLTNKINELGKNFIPTIGDKKIIFTNNAPMRCNGDVIPQGEPVSSMIYNYKFDGPELIEKAQYTGCLGQISLVEDVVTRGEKIAPLTFSDFVKGKREFDLKEGESFKLYRLSNAENEEIFKLVVEKKDNAKTVVLSLFDQPFLQMNFDFKPESTRLTLTYTGYKVRYQRKFSTWEWTNLFDPVPNTVFVTKGPVNQIHYLDMYGGPLTQNEFISRFDNRVTNGAIARVRKVMDYHVHYFPSTKVVQTGSGNERLKEELRITLNRLQNNTELNLVKKQIQDYIEAVENGFLTDTRPKQ